MDDFLSVPSQDLLESCSREQSASAAEHFNSDVGGKRMKENFWSVAPVVDGGVVSGCSDAGQTLEQRRELLLLLQAEVKKLAVERLRRETKMKRLEMAGAAAEFTYWRRRPCL